MPSYCHGYNRDCGNQKHFMATYCHGCQNNVETEARIAKSHRAPDTRGLWDELHKQRQRIIELEKKAATHDD